MGLLVIGRLTQKEPRRGSGASFPVYAFLFGRVLHALGPPYGARTSHAHRAVAQAAARVLLQSLTVQQPLITALAAYGARTSHAHRAVALATARLIMNYSVILFRT